MSELTQVQKECEYHQEIKENLLSLVQTYIAAGEIEKAKETFDVIDKAYKVMDDHLKNIVEVNKIIAETENEKNRQTNDLIDTAIKVIGTGLMIGGMCLFEAKGHVFTTKAMSILPKPHI